MTRPLSKSEKKDYIRFRDDGQHLGNDYTTCTTYRHLWHDEEPFFVFHLVDRVLHVEWKHDK